MAHTSAVMVLPRLALPSWMVNSMSDKRVGRMQVVMRRPGERLRIGEQIVIEVLWVAEDRVVLSIQAPTDTSIVRPEVAEWRRWWAAVEHDVAIEPAVTEEAGLATPAPGC